MNITVVVVCAGVKVMGDIGIGVCVCVCVSVCVLWMHALPHSPSQWLVVITN